MNLTTKGQSAPFCVWAKTQTAGRGRRGKSWIGATGNLYMTLVLPSDAIHFAEKGLVPIAVATILVDWIREYFALQTRIKWPNDIVFGAEKLGGILCESSIQGAQWSNIFIGIGINLNDLPREELEYRACSIASISGAAVENVEACVNALTVFFSDRWKELTEENVRAAFARRGIHQGLPWQEGETFSPIFLNGKLQAGGGIDFSTPNETGVYSLTSAHHELRCLYFKSIEPVPFFVADVGNTALKIACYEDHRTNERVVVRAISNREFTANLLRDAVQAISPSGWSQPGMWPFYIASVNRELEHQLAGYLRELNFSPVLVAKTPVYRRENSSYLLADLGIDRLALIEAWIKSQRTAVHVTGGRIGILVSAGTATTIDVVEGSGRHLLGEILPGLQMALTALSERTSLLPVIDLAQVDIIAPLGINTVTAMTRGVLDMTVGAIRQCIDLYLGQGSPASTNIDIVLTGGYARLLSRELGVLESNINTLSGIKILVLGA